MSTVHYGNIDKPTTAAGRVYRTLKHRRRGSWTTTAGVAELAKTYCPSTRISEVRRQLEARDNGERIESWRRPDGVWVYRLVCARASRPEGMTHR